MKKAILLICIFIGIAISINAKEPTRQNDFEKAPITAERIIVGLSGRDWVKNSEYFSANSSEIRGYVTLRNDLRIQNRLVECLKEALEFRKKEMAKYESMRVKDISTKFRVEFDKAGFDHYLTNLAFTVWDFDDPKIIPLIIAVGDIYGSESFNLRNFLRHFEKKAFPEFLKIAQGGEEENKISALGHLGTWVNWTLNKESAKKDNTPFDSRYDLSEGEVREVKDLLMKEINSSDSRKRLSASYGLKYIARGKRDTNEKNEIKIVLGKRLADRDFYVRKQIVEIMGEIGDNSDLEKMDQMLKDGELDPAVEFQRKTQIRTSGRSDLPLVYPVREEARKAIEQIKMRESIKLKR
jgi:hypothetical protein